MEMSPSYCHKGFKHLVAHHMSPLHMCAPLIRKAYTTDSLFLKRILCKLINCYDCFFKLTLLHLLSTDNRSGFDACAHGKNS